MYYRIVGATCSLRFRCAVRFVRPISAIVVLIADLRLADATAVSRARSPPGRYRPCNLCSRYISTGKERTGHLHSETRYMDYSFSMYNYARLVPGADVLFLVVHYAIAAAVEKAVRVGGYNPYVREYRAISWARQGNSNVTCTWGLLVYKYTTGQLQKQWLS